MKKISTTQVQAYRQQWTTYVYLLKLRDELEEKLLPLNEALLPYNNKNFAGNLEAKIIAYAHIIKKIHLEINLQKNNISKLLASTITLTERLNLPDFNQILSDLHKIRDDSFKRLLELTEIHDGLSENLILFYQKEIQETEIKVEKFNNVTAKILKNKAFQILINKIKFAMHQYCLGDAKAADFTAPKHRGKATLTRYDCITKGISRYLYELSQEFQGDIINVNHVSPNSIQNYSLNEIFAHMQSTLNIQKPVPVRRLSTPVFKEIQQVIETNRDFKQFEKQKPEFTSIHLDKKLEVKLQAVSTIGTTTPLAEVIVHLELFEKYLDNSMSWWVDQRTRALLKELSQSITLFRDELKKYQSQYLTFGAQNAQLIQKYKNFIEHIKSPAYQKPLVEDRKKLILKIQEIFSFPDLKIDLEFKTLIPSEISDQILKLRQYAIDLTEQDQIFYGLQHKLENVRFLKDISLKQLLTSPFGLLAHALQQVHGLKATKTSGNFVLEDSPSIKTVELQELLTWNNLCDGEACALGVFNIFWRKFSAELLKAAAALDHEYKTLKSKKAEFKAPSIQDVLRHLDEKNSANISFENPLTKPDLLADLKEYLQHPHLIALLTPSHHYTRRLSAQIKKNILMILNDVSQDFFGEISLNKLDKIESKLYTANIIEKGMKKGLANCLKFLNIFEVICNALIGHYENLKKENAIFCESWKVSGNLYENLLNQLKQVENDSETLLKKFKEIYFKNNESDDLLIKITKKFSEIKGFQQRKRFILNICTHSSESKDYEKFILFKKFKYLASKLNNSETKSTDEDIFFPESFVMRQFTTIYEGIYTAKEFSEYKEKIPNLWKALEGISVEAGNFLILLHTSGGNIKYKGEIISELLECHGKAIVEKRFVLQRLVHAEIFRILNSINLSGAEFRLEFVERVAKIDGLFVQEILTPLLNVARALEKLWAVFEESNLNEKILQEQINLNEYKRVALLREIRDNFQDKDFIKNIGINDSKLESYTDTLAIVKKFINEVDANIQQMTIPKPELKLQWPTPELSEPVDTLTLLSSNETDSKETLKLKQAVVQVCPAEDIFHIDPPLVFKKASVPDKESKYEEKKSQLVEDEQLRVLLKSAEVFSQLKSEILTEKYEDADLTCTRLLSTLNILTPANFFKFWNDESLDGDIFVNSSKLKIPFREFLKSKFMADENFKTDLINIMNFNLSLCTVYETPSFVVYLTSAFDISEAESYLTSLEEKYVIILTNSNELYVKMGQVFLLGKSEHIKDRHGLPLGENQLKKIENAELVKILIGETRLASLYADSPLYTISQFDEINRDKYLSEIKDDKALILTNDDKIYVKNGPKFEFNPAWSLPDRGEIPPWKPNISQESKLIKMEIPAEREAVIKFIVEQAQPHLPMLELWRIKHNCFQATQHDNEETLQLIRIKAFFIASRILPDEESFLPKTFEKMKIRSGRPLSDLAVSYQIKICVYKEKQAIPVAQYPGQSYHIRKCSILYLYQDDNSWYPLLYPDLPRESWLEKNAGKMVDLIALMDTWSPPKPQLLHSTLSDSADESASASSSSPSATSSTSSPVSLSGALAGVLEWLSSQKNNHSSAASENISMSSSSSSGSEVISSSSVSSSSSSNSSSLGSIVYNGLKNLISSPSSASSSSSGSDVIVPLGFDVSESITTASSSSTIAPATALFTPGRTVNSPDEQDELSLQATKPSLSNPQKRKKKSRVVKIESPKQKSNMDTSPEEVSPTTPVAPSS